MPVSIIDGCCSDAVNRNWLSDADVTESDKPAKSRSPEARRKIAARWEPSIAEPAGTSSSAPAAAFRRDWVCAGDGEQVVRGARKGRALDAGDRWSPLFRTTECRDAPEP